MEPFIQVACCWNGVTVFDADIMVRGDVRFRRGDPHRAPAPGGTGDCSNSECSIFCRDARAAGYGNIVVDPNVQVAYFPESAEHVRRPLPKDGPEVATAEAFARWRLPEEGQCCPLLENGTLYIKWEECFSFKHAKI